jgi:hypothetical protein
LKGKTLQKLTKSCGLMNETGKRAYCSKKLIEASFFIAGLITLSNAIN